jgi:hypothetical protein
MTLPMSSEIAADMLLPPSDDYAVADATAPCLPIHLRTYSYSACKFKGRFC